MMQPLPDGTCMTPPPPVQTAAFWPTPPASRTPTPAKLDFERATPNRAARRKAAKVRRCKRQVAG